MKNVLKQRVWSPYLVGVLIGLLLIASVVFFDKILGTSKAVATLAAFLQSLFFYKQALNLSYFSHYLTDMPVFDFQFALIIGVFLGAFISSFLSGRNRWDVPLIWKSNFGGSKPKRFFAAFAGGMIVIFGARLAGGCTSGQVISGASRLAIAGWTFGMGLFASGIVTALVMYRKNK